MKESFFSKNKILKRIEKLKKELEPLEKDRNEENLSVNLSVTYGRLLGQIDVYEHLLRCIDSEEIIIKESNEDE